MMVKYFCDNCAKERKSLNSLDILVHITNNDTLSNHVTHLDGELLPISSRKIKIQLCLKCYNKIVGEMWQSIKDNVKPNLNL